jgi:uncharacterized delta-60 repeat protein
MSGSRTRRLQLANKLGLACVAATCFLAACGDSDDSGGNDPKGGAAGTTNKAGSGGAAKAGAANAGRGGASAGSGQGGDENVAGDTGEGGEAGDTGNTAGNGGSTAGSGGTAGGGVITAGAGGSAAGSGDKGGAGGASGGSGGASGGSGGASGGSGGTSGSAGSGGAPVVLVPNCVRNTTHAGKKIEVNPTGHDALYGVAFTAAGDLYATGYVQDGITNTVDRSTVVVKIKADGTLDTSWPTNAGAAVGGTGNGTGIVKKNVVDTGALAGQGELARSIAFQGTKIIVAGTVEAYSTLQDPAYKNGDRNVFVLRLNADGSLDTTFGDPTATAGVKTGVHILPLSEGVPNAAGTAITAADAQYGLNVLADGSIIVTSGTRSPIAADRTDTDFAVVKLTPDGAQDATFGLVGGTPGVFTLDIAQASVSVRTTSVLSDGKMIVTGYSTYGGTQRPVIFKLNADGKALDTTFGSLGVFAEPIGTAGEAYGALVQKIAPNVGKLVTVGYGRATAATTATDILSLRLTPNGVLDTTYGNTTGTNPTPGRAWFDVYGLGDNGYAIVLSDDRPVLIGRGNTASGQLDAVITLLSTEGKPVTAFGSPYGCNAYDFGSIGDNFQGGDVSAVDGKIAAVGSTSHATTSTEDSDGILLVLPKP